MKITVEGKEKLQSKIKTLQAELQKIRDEKANAYVLTGDTWHDNPYFNQLEQAEQRALLKLSELQTILEEANIVNRDSQNPDVIDIGSIVKCSCLYAGEDEPEEEIYEIVGHGEADVEKGKIAYDSLVAKNIIGHKVNDEITFEIPSGKVKYKILAIFSDWKEARE